MKRIKALLCFIVVLGFTFSVWSATNWTSFMKDEVNSGLVGETIEQTSLYFKWETQLYGKVLGSPIIVDGRIYQGTEKGIFYCLDLYSGKTIWKYQITGADVGATRKQKIPKNIYSTPSYGDGKVYFTSFNGLLYCLDAYTGKKLWTFKVGNNTIASPLYVNGVVLCGSGFKKGLYGLQGDTGRELFFLKTNKVITSAPAFYNNKIYALDVEGTLYCFNFTTKQEEWEFPVPTGFVFTNSLSLANEKIFFYPSYGQRIDVNENDLFELDLKANVIWQIDPMNLTSNKASQKAKKSISVTEMMSILNKTLAPNPQNPGMYDPKFLKLTPQQEKALTKRMKSQISKNIRRRLKAKYRRHKAKAGALKAGMRKVSNPIPFPKQYSSNLVVKGGIAYFQIVRQGSADPHQADYYLNHHYLFAVNLASKSLVFYKELGKTKEMADNFLPPAWVGPVDAIDISRLTPSPIVVGDKIFALTPAGKIRMYNLAGNLLWEDGGFSIFYASPAYYDGMLVAVDKYGKMGCYGVTSTNTPKVRIIEPAEQLTVNAGETPNIKVKWLVSGVDSPNYYVHFYYDTDNSGYDGKPASGLQFLRLTAAPEGYWSVGELPRDKFYYLYGVISDAPLGKDPIKDAQHVYYGEYTKFSVLITNDAKAPHITLLSPPDEVEIMVSDDKQKSYMINWTDYDEDSDAEISLYYAPTPSMEKAKLIKSGISEDDEKDYYMFNTMIAAQDEDIMTSGKKVYFIARIYDGDGPAVFSYSPGYLVLNYDVQVTHLSITHHPLSDQYNTIDTKGYDVIAYVSGPRSLSNAQVILHYKLEGEATYQELQMTSIDDYKFSAQIPRVDGGKTVQYYITADDGVEQARVPEDGEYSFKVESYSGFVASQYSWMATIEVMANNYKADFSWGMSSDSGVSVFYDEKDQPMELSDDKGIYLYTEVLRDRKSKEKVTLKKDIVPDKKLDNDLFLITLTLKAKNLKGEKVDFSWNVDDVKSKYTNYSVMLIDEGHNCAVDMKRESSYQLDILSDDFTYQLKIATGLAYFERRCQQGWNLVALPVKPLDNNLKPLDISKYFANIFPKNKNYVVYYYDPKNKEFIGYNPRYGGKLKYFDFGKAYWLKLPEDKILPFKGYTASKFQSYGKKGLFEIQLHSSDWNMISSPLLQPIEWNKLTFSYQGVNLNLRDAIYSGWIKSAAFLYDNGGFRIVSLLEWKNGDLRPTDEMFLSGYGYFLYSKVSCKIIFPLPTSTSYAPPKENKTLNLLGTIQKKSIFAKVKEWRCQLKVKLGDYADDDNYFGILPIAEDGSDIMDSFEPSPMAPAVSLYFPHNDYFKEPGDYTVDYRGPVDENGNITWNVEIKKTKDIKDNKLTLSWKLEKFPKDYYLILKDLDTGTEYNMQTVSKVTLKMNGEIKKLKIIYYKFVKP